MLRLFRRKQEKSRAQARAVMAQLWAQLRELERVGKVPSKVLFVVEDGALARALERKASDKIGVVNLREQGSATEAARKFAEAALAGFRTILVLRTGNWIGWAILVRSLLRSHVGIIASRPFDVRSASAPWQPAPAPFSGWYYLPPNGWEDLAPSREDSETEAKLLDILDDWDGEPCDFLEVPF